MAISFPATLDALTNPVGTDYQSVVDHASQHANANDAIEALEAKLGITASTPTAGKYLYSTGTGLSAWTAGAACRVRQTNGGAATSIPYNVVTVINMDTEDLDTDTMHFTSSAALTGTVAKTAASTALVGTGTLFTSELSIGQVISVPGTAPEKRVVTGISDNTHLTVSAAFTFTATGQTATRVNSAIVARTAGNYDCGGYFQFAANAGGNRRIGQLLKNGTAFAESELPSASAGFYPTPRPGTIIDMAQWDYIELAAYQDSGGALDALYSAFKGPALWMKLI